MDREWVMLLLRAYCPVAVLVGSAFFMMVPSADLRSNWPLTGIADLPNWISLAMVGAALAMFAAISYRLWKWEYGDGPSCVVCGGPLGGERSGRDDRGGRFRRCYACGKAVNHRYYE